jgi:flagellar protein FliO/FliZ
MDDISQYFRFAAALVFVLALIGAVAFIARALGFLNPIQRKPGERRLSMVEMLSLDPRRRLVLVRRDDKEYLILLSPTGETVLESGVDARLGLDAPMSGSTFLTIKTEPR